MMERVLERKISRRMTMRLLVNSISKYIFLLATLFGLVVLSVLIYRVFSEGFAWLNLDFLTGKLSTQPDRAGIMGAILGTFWLMLVVAPVTMFLGVGTAIYLELYVKKGRLQGFIQTNISNLAGVPSIVYGILGLTVFARAMNFGNIVLAGGLTMSLLILPIVIVASQEAIRAVPNPLSEASYGMGATKWQTIKGIILPVALPGILTGCNLIVIACDWRNRAISRYWNSSVTNSFSWRDFRQVYSPAYANILLDTRFISHCGVCKLSSCNNHCAAYRFIIVKYNSNHHSQ